MIMMNNASPDDCFNHYAALDQDGFYQALFACGFPDLSSSHLATFVFDHLSSSNNYSTSASNNNKRITRRSFHGAVELASTTTEFFRSRNHHTIENGLTFQQFQDIGSRKQ